MCPFKRKSDEKSQLGVCYEVTEIEAALDMV